MDTTAFADIRTLVVDDDSESCEYSSILLKRLGVRHEYVSSGESALEALGEAEDGGDPYKLCLIDWKMPVMDGYEATVAIRESGREDAKRVPIYAMTANAFSEDVTSALDAGMNGHIAKPIETKVLYQTLEMAFKENNKI